LPKLTKDATITGSIFVVIQSRMIAQKAILRLVAKRSGHDWYKHITK
jgi:hypothetical protein